MWIRRLCVLVKQNQILILHQLIFFQVMDLQLALVIKDLGRVSGWKLLIFSTFGCQIFCHRRQTSNSVFSLVKSGEAEMSILRRTGGLGSIAPQLQGGKRL